MPERFEVGVRFTAVATPIFCKPRFVPFAMQVDLAQAYYAGIEKGIWTPVQFNDRGTQ